MLAGRQRNQVVQKSYVPHAARSYCTKLQGQEYMEQCTPIYTYKIAIQLTSVGLNMNFVLLQKQQQCQLATLLRCFMWEFDIRGLVPPAKDRFTSLALRIPKKQKNFCDY